MHEIAATQDAAGLTPALFDAMADVFAALSASELARSTPEEIPADATLDDVLAGLQRRGGRMSAADRRARFRALHARDELFVMPNPWDIGSARLLAAEGFEALATTSQGFAWALGKQDQTVTRDELVAHVPELAAATPLPLNVDSERCYPDDPGGIAETVALLSAAGAAGFSIEDYDPVCGRGWTRSTWPRIASPRPSRRRMRTPSRSW